MRLQQRKAVRTEYMGTVFRSKSEAIFAHCLDLAGNVWEYESATDAGHSWDFTIWNGIDGQSRCLVELKPTKPTDCYFANLKRNTRRWHSKLGWPPSHESVLIYGTPFADTDPCYELLVVSSPRLEYTERDSEWPQSSRVIDLLGIDRLVVASAMQYRFDLQEASCG